VTNLGRPGGNITGVSFASAPLMAKRLGLLHELVPPGATIAWLRQPGAPGIEREEKQVPPAARELGRDLLALDARSVQEIDAAFASIVQLRAGALLIGSGILFNNRRRQLAALAARHGLPAIGGIREFVLAGGLMSYGASDTNAFDRLGDRDHDLLLSRSPQGAPGTQADIGVILEWSPLRPGLSPEKRGEHACSNHSEAQNYCAPNQRGHTGSRDFLPGRGIGLLCESIHTLKENAGPRL
jgi:ABC-type uncharacterized transport system substrate-binding protein